jgi:hypothetical protein
MKVSKRQVFFKIVFAMTSLGIIFACSLYCISMAVSHNPGLYKKTPGFPVWGYAGFLFAGSMFRRVLPALAALPAETMLCEPLSFNRRRTASFQPASSRGDPPIRPVPKPAVSKLPRG